MSKKLLIMIFAVVVLLGAGAGSYFMFFAASPKDEAGAATASKDEPAGLVAMDQFLVNINDPQGGRYAKVQIQLSVVPASVAEEVAADPLIQAKMRDRILTLLSTKTFDELSSPIGKEGFRREVRARLDPLVEDGEIQEVLFQEFLVQ